MQRVDYGPLTYAIGCRSSCLTVSNPICADSNGGVGMFLDCFQPSTSIWYTDTFDRWLLHCCKFRCFMSYAEELWLFH